MHEINKRKSQRYHKTSSIHSQKANFWALLTHLSTRYRFSARHGSVDAVFLLDQLGKEIRYVIECWENYENMFRMKLGIMSDKKFSGAGGEVAWVG